MAEKKYRLLTRADVDGVVAAVLLRELGLIEAIQFVHPKEMQDGEVEVTGNDITTNLPYVEGVHLCFDHHYSESLRVGSKDNLVNVPGAPSAARVVYDYYGGKDRFPDLSDELMAAVDQADSAQYTIEDILAPTRWTLLNFIMDPRTGLDRFQEFAISNHQLMRDLAIYMRAHSIEEILAIPDVQERVRFYIEHDEAAEMQMKRCAVEKENMVIVDFRNEEIIHPVNRFMIYALYPQANVSLHAYWGEERKKVVFAVGKSILNRTSKTNIGKLMLEYGGGGHKTAGTCQVKPEDAERILSELIERISADG